MESNLTNPSPYANVIASRVTEDCGKVNCTTLPEAEAVAFVISQAIGLDSILAAKDYIELYRGDATLLTESLELIQSTANSILEGIGAEEESSRAGREDNRLSLGRLRLR